jgi:hypothetical protein
VIGNYSSAPISTAAYAALVRLLAWRLDVAHVDPLSTLTWRSGGNPKYPLGRPVRLRAISGHRDTGPTSCPGNALYSRLPDLARAVAATGLPKLYAPVVAGGLGGPVRFSARLSTPSPWTVTVVNASGAVVARGRGTGTAVSWTWNAAGLTSGSYRWTIAAGVRTRPATGTIGRALPPPPQPAPVLNGLTVAPPLVTPDGDGIDDALTVSYVLTARATVTATMTDSTGAVVATLFAGQVQGARRQSFPYPVDALSAGTFTLAVSATGPDGRTVRQQAPFAVDRTLSGLALSSPELTPNGDGSGDTLGISFTLAAATNVVVQIEQEGTFVASVFSGPLPVGPAALTWDGTTPGGPAPPGTYQAVVLADGPFGQTRHALSFTIPG